MYKTTKKKQNNSQDYLINHLKSRSKNHFCAGQKFSEESKENAPR